MRSLLATAAALIGLASLGFSAPLPPEDPWVLFCHTAPAESNIRIHEDDFLKREAKTAGVVTRGWSGTTCTLYGKLVANRKGANPALVADIPADPNFIMIHVSLGPIPYGGDRPSVQFSAGATMAEDVFNVSFEKGRLIAWADDWVFDPANPDNPPAKKYFALAEWRFMVIKQSEAGDWGDSIRVRASLYSLPE